MDHEHIRLKTEDGIELSGDFYKGGEKGIILLHMLGVTRKTWDDFASELQKKGYSVVAIDLRGHGESDLDFNEFNENDFNNIILDAATAKKFLNKKKIAVIGASIGANTAIKFANEVNVVIALSPGLNYRGIDAENFAENDLKPTLFVVSEEDNYSFKSSQKLKELIKNSELKVYKGKGHGTRMLDRETKEFIIKWLDQNFR